MMGLKHLFSRIPPRELLTVQSLIFKILRYVWSGIRIDDMHAMVVAAV